MKRAERERFLAKSIITSLRSEREAGRSLALLKPDVLEFVAERKSAADLEDEAKRFDALRAQGDLFSKKSTPRLPCPYRFKYRYRTDDGERFGTCQDWEIEATYFNWSKLYGETKALDELQRVFGEEYPKKGMLLAMGTHSLYPDTWLINGVIRLDDVKQSSLF